LVLVVLVRMLLRLQHHIKILLQQPKHIMEEEVLPRLSVALNQEAAAVAVDHKATTQKVQAALAAVAVVVILT
tara:strand:- start:394 stop:612 length:219 start_codon:yes stop_codon:yes gene_type:complete